MTNQNTVLADILDRGAAVTESENLLAALADHGVFIPVNAQGSVEFGNVTDTLVILGYTSEERCMQHCPAAATAFYCGSLRLIDIARQSNVGTMAVFSANGWAKVPLHLLFQTLRERGLKTQGTQTLKLSWSTHPLAVALRDATRDHIHEFPGVTTVWIGHARWLESGNENLMLHVEVTEDAPPETTKNLMDALMSRYVLTTVDDPFVGVRVLHPTREAKTISEINSIGLDTIRIDHTTGQVDIISQEYD